MITLFQSDTICTLAEIKSQMAGYIQQLPAKVSSIGKCVTILRYELRCELIEILTWLHNQKNKYKKFTGQTDKRVLRLGASVLRTA